MSRVLSMGFVVGFSVCSAYALPWEPEAEFLPGRVSSRYDLRVLDQRTPESFLWGLEGRSECRAPNGVHELDRTSPVILAGPDTVKYAVTHMIVGGLQSLEHQCFDFDSYELEGELPLSVASVTPEMLPSWRNFDFQQPRLSTFTSATSSRLDSADHDIDDVENPTEYTVAVFPLKVKRLSLDGTSSSIGKQRSPVRKRRLTWGANETTIGELDWVEARLPNPFDGNELLCKGDFGKQGRRAHEVTMSCFVLYLQKWNKVSHLYPPESPVSTASGVATPSERRAEGDSFCNSDDLGGASSDVSSPSSPSQLGLSLPPLAIFPRLDSCRSGGVVGDKEQHADSARSFASMDSHFSTGESETDESEQLHVDKIASVKHEYVAAKVAQLFSPESYSSPTHPKYIPDSQARASTRVRDIETAIGLLLKVGSTRADELRQMFDASVDSRPIPTLQAPDNYPVAANLQVSNEIDLAAAHLAAAGKDKIGLSSALLSGMFQIPPARALAAMLGFFERDETLLYRQVIYELARQASVSGHKLTTVQREFVVAEFLKGFRVAVDVVTALLDECIPSADDATPPVDYGWATPYQEGSALEMLRRHCGKELSIQSLTPPPVSSVSPKVVVREATGRNGTGAGEELISIQEEAAAILDRRSFLQVHQEALQVPLTHELIRFMDPHGTIVDTGSLRKPVISQLVSALGINSEDAALKVNRLWDAYIAQKESRVQRGLQKSRAVLDPFGSLTPPPFLVGIVGELYGLTVFDFVTKPTFQCSVAAFKPAFIARVLNEAFGVSEMKALALAYKHMPVSGRNLYSNLVHELVGFGNSYELPLRWTKEIVVPHIAAIFQIEASVAEAVFDRHVGEGDSLRSPERLSDERQWNMVPTPPYISEVAGRLTACNSQLHKVSRNKLLIRVSAGSVQNVTGVRFFEGYKALLGPAKTQVRALKKKSSRTNSAGAGQMKAKLDAAKNVNRVTSL